MELDHGIKEVAQEETWDLVKYLLTSAVAGLALALVYLFNQIQKLKDQSNSNATAIALNNAHDQGTDNTLNEIKGLIEKLEAKIDTLILRK